MRLFTLSLGTREANILVTHFWLPRKVLCERGKSIGNVRSINALRKNFLEWNVKIPMNKIITRRFWWVLIGFECFHNFLNVVFEFHWSFAIIKSKIFRFIKLFSNPSKSSVHPHQCLQCFHNVSTHISWWWKTFRKIKWEAYECKRWRASWNIEHPHHLHHGRKTRLEVLFSAVESTWKTSMWLARWVSEKRSKSEAPCSVSSSTGRRKKLFYHIKSSKNRIWNHLK